jgi:hypothetical protein
MRQMQNTSSKAKYKRISATLLVLYILLSIVSSIELFPKNSFYANASLNDAEALILNVNTERIRAQLLLAEDNLNEQEYQSAFDRSYILHSAIYPSIKESSRELDLQTSVELEAILTDLPIKIKQMQDEGNYDAVKDIVNSINQSLSMVSSLENKVSPLVSNF